jgi:UDP-2,3-diacylglucosamine pyrophosphatase LpxH
VRTLVISDLHLGNRSGCDVLRHPLVLERLLRAVDGVDRLVLLGDTMELMHRRAERSMALAEPVMRAIGRRLGADREVIVVPGNHDAPLTLRWARAEGPRLGPSSDVPAAASPFLERLLSWLAPAQTRVNYPGVWLGDRIWATHGHYLDRHLIPDSAVGIRRPRLRREPSAAVLPMDYERRRRASRGSLPEQLMSRPLGTFLERLAHVLRATNTPHLSRLLLDGGLAQATATLVDTQMRFAGIPAMARVVRRLGVDAEVVLFGHVHRRGPIGRERWPADNGTRFINTGAWLYEPVLVNRATPPHGYWPGGAVLLEPGREPRSLGLLDDLRAADLRPRSVTSAAGPASGR